MKSTTFFLKTYLCISIYFIPISRQQDEKHTFYELPTKMYIIWLSRHLIIVCFFFIFLRQYDLATTLWRSIYCRSFLCGDWWVGASRRRNIWSIGLVACCWFALADSQIIVLNVFLGVKRRRRRSLCGVLAVWQLSLGHLDVWPPLVKCESNTWNIFIYKSFLELDHTESPSAENCSFICSF